MAKRSQAERAAIGGKARAQKLSPERRREIAMKGARASMAKARGEYTAQPKRPDAIAALAEKNEAGRSEEAEARTALLLDPVDWITHYLRNPETGLPFDLYPEEVTFLREGFTPDPETMKLRYDEVIFSAPKKSGKTQLAAMVILYVICALGGDRAEGYIVSNSREQASDRIFSDCAAVLKCSREITANPRNDVIEFPVTDSFVKTVTTEAKSAAGPRPTIVVGDEIWGIVNEAGIRLWDEMAPTPTAQVSVRLITTYAGFVGESQLLEGYYRRIFAEDGSLQEGVKQVGTDLYAKGRTLVYWTHAWRAPWQTPEWIDTMRQAYSNRPNQFARIMENRWVSSESSFIEAEQLSRCIDIHYKPPRNAPHLHVWTAVDASVKKDSTAIVTVALDSEEVSEKKTLLDQIRSSKYPHPNALIECLAQLPWKEDFDDTTPPMTLKDLRLKVIDHKIIVPRAGAAINFVEVEHYIIGLSRRYHLELCAYDPFQMVAVAQGLVRFGIPMFEMAQTHSNISGFTELLADLVSQERLRAYPADDLKQHILNCVAKESDRGRHIVKKARSQKIDAAVALAMACYGCAMSFSVSDEPDEAPSDADIYAV